MQTTPLKLLMVEDSSMDAELILMRLERSGFQVQSRLMFDHVGAEHALHAGTFDLILCDCVLPGSSGAEVLAIAQRIAPATPFIFLSGIYGEEHAVEMIRLGATDYVLKKNLPLLPKAVRRALTEVQERQRRRSPRKPWPTWRPGRASPSMPLAWVAGITGRKMDRCSGTYVARPCSACPPTPR